MKLEGKIAIVTGSSRGIGKAIAIGLAREGANVVAAARTVVEKQGLPGTIDKTADEIRALGRQAMAVQCDVSNEESVQATVRQTLDQFGRIDILINNAAVAFYAPVVETPTKRWDLVQRVNLGGTFHCTKAVLPKMVEQRSGSIINISSPAGTMTFAPSGVAYAVSKAAIERFTVCLSTEVGQHNIAVNCLMPARPVDTEGMRFWNPETDWSRWAKADAMVKAAIFLAAQDGSGVTGTVCTDEEVCVIHGLTVTKPLGID